MDTTTTPGAPSFFCEHKEHESRIEIDRHEQMTDGKVNLSFTAKIEIWCKQCGRRMLFPCPQKHFHESHSLPMVAYQEGMETIP